MDPYQHVICVSSLFTTIIRMSEWSDSSHLRIITHSNSSLRLLIALSTQYLIHTSVRVHCINIVVKRDIDQLEASNLIYLFATGQ